MDPVQEQLEAYNARDLDRFVSCYAPETVIEDGGGVVMVQGQEGIRSFYRNLFEQSPALHCEVSNRMRVGKYVVDEEHVTGLQLEGFPSEVHAAVIYTVDGDRITHVRLLW